MKKITIDGVQYNCTPIESKTKEQRFLELIEGIDLSNAKTDFGKYPDSIFWFFPNGDFAFKYDFKYHHFWISYDCIWKVFHDDFGMNRFEIQYFMKAQVEKHFKLKGVTPQGVLGAVMLEVEKHFKLKGVTPRG